MLKKIKSIIILFVKKILNYRGIYYSNIIKVNIHSIKNLEVKKGKIVFKGSATILDYSKIGIRNGGNIILGDNFYANRNFTCICYDNILIKDNVSIGPNVCIYDHDHQIGRNGKITEQYKTNKIVIGNNVWIGAGAIILKGSKIGDNCVIGAGTVVKGEIPSNSLVTSNRKLKIVRLKDNN